MRPSGMVEDQSNAGQMEEAVGQGETIGPQSGVETQGQGSIEMSSKYEVVKSPGMQEGNMQLNNDDLLAQQTNQAMEEPKGDEQTGANVMAVEEISGETKQAITNTLAALDKQGTKFELENCCQADPKSSCCLQAETSPIGK